MKKLQHWFQRKLRSRATLAPQMRPRPPSALERGSSISAEDPEELLAQDIAKLDLQRALVHHLEWCVVFNDRLHRANSLLTETEAHLPDAQESGLGQWLTHAARLPIGQHSLFADLCREHERLHELANQALCHARNGRMDLASTLLNTDFERSRLRVLETLRELQRL